MEDIELLGIGNPIIDTSIKVEDAFLSSLGLTKGGMTILDDNQANELFSYIDSLDKSSLNLTEQTGCTISNTLINFASFGGKTAYIGRVGDDDMGQFFHKNICEHSRVTCINSLVKGSQPTGRCLVIITPDGKRTMCTYLGATKELEISDIEENLVYKSKMVILPGYLLDHEHGREIIDHTINLAKEMNRKVIMALADPECIKRHHSNMVRYVNDRKVNLLFANQKEICTVFGKTSFLEAQEVMQKICQKNNTIAALTCSEKGVNVVTRKEIIHANAVPVAPEDIIDTTGIGSIFMSGFLYPYLHGYHVKKCAEIATAAAATGLKTMGPRSDCDMSYLMDTKLTTNLRN